MEKLVNNMVEMLGSCDEKTNNLALNILKIIKNCHQLSIVNYLDMRNFVLMSIKQYNLTQKEDIPLKHFIKYFMKINLKSSRGLYGNMV